jgi:hypothetical protein
MRSAQQTGVQIPKETATAVIAITAHFQTGACTASSPDTNVIVTSTTQALRRRSPKPGSFDGKREKSPCTQ